MEKKNTKYAAVAAITAEPAEPAAPALNVQVPKLFSPSYTDTN